jgi:hypothetical protein
MPSSLFTMFTLLIAFALLSDASEIPSGRTYSSAKGKRNCRSPRLGCDWSLIKACQAGAWMNSYLVCSLLGWHPAGSLWLESDSSLLCCTNLFSFTFYSQTKSEMKLKSWGCSVLKTSKAGPAGWQRSDSSRYLMAHRVWGTRVPNAALATGLWSVLVQKHSWCFHCSIIAFDLSNVVTHPSKWDLKSFEQRA